MTEGQLRDLNDWVLDRFTYRRDPERSDRWRSSAQALLADASARFEDDCDGLAMTVAELAHILGADDVWRLMVSTERNGEIDHMVAAVRVEGGACFMVGDTGSDRPVPIGRVPYQILMANHIGAGLDWIGWDGRLPETKSGAPGSPT